MNQKGFAVSSVIYGLTILGILIVAILMGTLSSTRNNISKEAQAVEEFLLNFNQTEVSYKGSQTGTTYRVPDGESGWYRVEAFGKGTPTALGAYTTGIIFMNAGDSFIINISSNTDVYISSNPGSAMMRAAGGSDPIPGGGIKCYTKLPAGGSINMTTYQLTSNTYTGIDDIEFINCSQSSWIKGYPGSDYDGSTFDPGVDPVDLTYQDYYFIDGLILPAASGVFDGKVVIRRIAGKDETLSTIPRKNKKFDNVSLIDVTFPADLNLFNILYSYHEDDDHDGHYTEHVKSCASNPCHLDTERDLDEVNVLFYEDVVNEETGVTSKMEFVAKNAHHLQVKLGNQVIYQSGVYSGTDTGTTIGRGIHLSAYQPDSYVSSLTDKTNSFPDHGNYYLIPITSENMVLSATSNVTDDANKLQIEHLTGESRQIWSIDKINDINGSAPNFSNIPNQSGRKEYRIMELARYKALNIYYDENSPMNFVSAAETFNTLSRNEPQIWNILPMGDTTYAIKTVVPSFSSTQKSGFLFAKPSGEGPNNINDVMIGQVYNPGTSEIDTLPTNVERFMLFSLDFSQ